jgi:hypothetical protein
MRTPGVGVLILQASSEMEMLLCRYDLLALSSVLEEREREQKGESQAKPQGCPANPL